MGEAELKTNHVAMTSLLESFVGAVSESPQGRPCGTRLANFANVARQLLRQRERILHQIQEQS